ncbi:hypothetical protein DF048_05740 [Burkholderia seminalis]|nr:hypothetical protein DF048_05740 [Burkholderia seminalis]
MNNTGFESSNLSDFHLIPNVIETKIKSEGPNGTEIHSRITAFSGAFAKDFDYTTLPFIVSFSYRAGVPRASIGMFAISCRMTVRERILAFLSVIDYLELSGDLPSGSLEGHKRRITQSGQLTDRAAIVDEYDEFCTRASRDLSYDDLIAA